MFFSLGRCSRSDADECRRRQHRRRGHCRNARRPRRGVLDVGNGAGRDGLKEILERKEHKPRLARWILLLQEFELQIMQRQEITAAIVGTKHPKRSFHLIERNLGLGDFHLRDLSEKLKPIPRKRKKSLSLEGLDPSN